MPAGTQIRRSIPPGPSLKSRTPPNRRTARPRALPGIADRRPLARIVNPHPLGSALRVRQRWRSRQAINNMTNGTANRWPTPWPLIHYRNIPASAGAWQIPRKTIAAPMPPARLRSIRASIQTHPTMVTRLTTDSLRTAAEAPFRSRRLPFLLADCRCVANIEQRANGR